MEEVQNVVLSKDVRRLYNLLEIRIFDLSQNIQLTGHKFNTNQVKDTLERQYSIFQQTKPIFIELQIQTIYQMIHQISLNYTRISSILLQNLSDSQTKYQKIFQNKISSDKSVEQNGNKLQIHQSSKIQEQLKQQLQVKCKTLGGISLYNQNYLRGIQSQSKKAKKKAKNNFDQRQILKQLINAQISHTTDVQKITDNDQISKFIKQGNLKHDLYNHIEYQKDLQDIFKFFKDSQEEALNFLVQSKNEKQASKQQIIIGFHQLIQTLSEKKKAESQIIRTRVKKLLQNLRNLNKQLNNQLQIKQRQIQQIKLMLNVQKSTVCTQTQRATKSHTKIYQQQKADFKSFLDQLRIKHTKLEESFYSQVNQKSLLNQKSKKKDFFIQQLKGQIQKFKQYFRQNKINLISNKISKKEQKVQKVNIVQIKDTQVQEQIKEDITFQQQKKDRKKKIRYSTVAQNIKVSKIRQDSLPSQHTLQQTCLNFFKQKEFQLNKQDFQNNPTFQGKNINDYIKQSFKTQETKLIERQNPNIQNSVNQANTKFNFAKSKSSEEKTQSLQKPYNILFNQNNKQDKTQQQKQNQRQVQQSPDNLKQKYLQVNQLLKSSYSQLKTLDISNQSNVKPQRKVVPQLLYLTKYLQQNSTDLLKKNCKLINQIIMTILPSLSQQNNLQICIKEMICQQNQDTIKKDLQNYARSKLRRLKKQDKQILKLDRKDQQQIFNIIDFNNQELTSKYKLKKNIKKAYQHIRISGKGLLVNQEEFIEIFDNLLERQSQSNQNSLHSTEVNVSHNIMRHQKVNNNSLEQKTKTKLQRSQIKQAKQSKSISIQSKNAIQHQQMIINGSNEIRQINSKQLYNNHEDKLGRLPLLHCDKQSSQLLKNWKSIGKINTKNYIRNNFQLQQTLSLMKSKENLLEVGKKYKKKYFQQQSIQKNNISNILDYQCDRNIHNLPLVYRDHNLMRTEGQTHFQIAQLLKTKGLITELEWLQIQKVKCRQKNGVCSHFTKFSDFLKKHIHQIANHNTKRSALSLHISNIDGVAQSIMQDQLKISKKQNFHTPAKHQAKHVSEYSKKQRVQLLKSELPVLKRKVMKI